MTKTTRNNSPSLKLGIRHVLSLVAVFGAFASFPISAMAQGIAGQYTEQPPSATGNNPTQGGSDLSPTATGSTAPPPNGSAVTSGSANTGGTATSATGNGGSSVAAGSTAASASAPSNADANGKAGSATGSSTPSKLGIETAGGQNASAAKDSGGSAPIVPIILGILVLAALSGIALVMRSRRRSTAPTGRNAPHTT